MDNETILRSRGFTLMRNRLLWINRNLRMAFSYEAARDHDGRWLTKALSEHVPETDFVFHFSQAPDNPQVCRDILGEVALPSLVPYIRVGPLHAGGLERN
jgi:hypothetical protein